MFPRSSSFQMISRLPSLWLRKSRAGNSAIPGPNGGYLPRQLAREVFTRSLQSGKSGLPRLRKVPKGQPPTLSV
eukprot:938503-Pyramimonas_sp.AAC.1